MEQGRFHIENAGTALAVILGTFAMIAVAALLQSVGLGGSGSFFHDSHSGGTPHTTWTVTGDSSAA